MEAMNRLMKGRTTFMIAHRLSTLAGCDVRLELEGGCLVKSMPPLPLAAMQAFEGSGAALQANEEDT